MKRPAVRGTGAVGLSCFYIDSLANLVTDEKQGLMWVIADMTDILEDMEEGPEQGEWVKQVFIPTAEPQKPKRRKRAAT